MAAAVGSGWGEHGPAYLGLVMARWAWMTQDPSDEEFAELDDFIGNRLTPNESAFVRWALAG